MGSVTSKHRVKPEHSLIAGVVTLLVAVACLIGTMWGGSPATAAQVASPIVPVVTPDATPAVPAGTPEATEPASTGPTEVTVGIYLISIYGLDQQSSTFYADFYLWMRWRGENDPTFTVEMLNNIERWGLTMTPVYEEPQELPSGEFIQQFHVQGQFSSRLALDDYPLDKHGLSIVLEDSTFELGSQVYIADREQSGLDPNLRMGGWKITGWDITTPTHTYNTGFGDESSVGQEYSTLRFTLNIERPANFFLWKLLLPLVIVLLLGCSVLLIHPGYTEVRLAGPATALLTLVFLQQTYTSTLPENGNLVMLDKIYALAYALVIGLIAITIVTSHWLRTDEENLPRANRLDRIGSAVLFGIFVIGSAIFIGPLI